MDIERNADLTSRASWHAALSDAVRLGIIEELRLGDRSPGELQISLGLSSNLMAHHLKVLESVGIVSRRRSEGDRRRSYLTLSDRSALGGQGPKLKADRVLFVCTANSARSQLAAAMWARTAQVPAISAGTQPADEVAEGASAVADRRHLDLLDARPQAFADVPVGRDLVVAVCDNAYEDLGSVIDLHWSIPDPVRVGRAKAFDDAFDDLDRRIAELAPLVSSP